MTGAEPGVSVVIPLHGRPGVVDVLEATYRHRPTYVCEVVVAHCGPPEPALRAAVERAGVGTALTWLEIDRPEFNKSLALNVGVAAATGSLVLLHDADVVLPSDFFPAAVARVRPRTVCCLAAVVESRGPAHRRIAPGVLMCTTVDFRRVGGLKSGLSGWGWEDIDLLMRMRLCGIEITATGEGVHLTHPLDDTARRVSEERNRRLALAELAHGTVGGTFELDVRRGPAGGGLPAKPSMSSARPGGGQST